MRSWFLLLIACALSRALPAPPSLDERHVIKAPLWLTGDSRQAPEPKLAPKDLEATMQGSPARVLAVSGPADDLMLLLVLDLTGDLSAVSAAQEALAAAIDSAPDYAYIGLMHAQDGPKVLQDPTRDRDLLVNAVRSLTVSGKAALFDTVETVESIADAVLAKSNVRVAVLYVTDSEVANYREDFSNPVINSSDAHDLSRRFPEQLVNEKVAKLQASLARGQAPLFIVHLKSRADRLNEAYQNGLKALAETTGGSALFCRSIGEIGDAIRKTFNVVGAHYSVTIEAPEATSKAVDLQLALTGERAGESISYRTRFVLRRK